MSAHPHRARNPYRRGTRAAKDWGRGVITAISARCRARGQERKAAR